MIYTPNNYISSLKPAPGYFYDEEHVKRSFAWLENNIINVEGKLANKPFRLLPWQKMLLKPLLGFRHKETKIRQFRRLFCLIPKKSGKSMFCSALALYFMCTSKDAAPNIFNIACSYNQSQTIYDSSVKMIEKSPTLKQIGLTTKAHPSYQIILNTETKNASYRPLSAEGKDKDGLRPSVVFVDEGHQMVKFEVHDLLTDENALVNSFEPLVIYVSTAGEQEGTIFNSLFDYFLKIQLGKIKSNEDLAAIWGMTQDENWKDKEIQLKVNPSYGYTITEEDFNRFRKRAEVGDHEKNRFRRKRLNCFIPTASDHFINTTSWDDCEIEMGDDEFEHIFLNNQLYAGIDFAPKHDLSTIVFLADTGDKIYLKHTTWATGMEIRRKKHQGIDFEGWRRQGYLRMSHDKAVTDELFLHLIKQEIVPYEANLFSLSYDKSRIEHVMLELEADQNVGYHVIDVVQSHRNLNEPTNSFYSLVMNKEILHRKDPLLRYCVANTTINENRDELIKVDKANPMHKIDIVDATIFALDALLRHRGKAAPIFIMPEIEDVPTMTSSII